jgi:hypothetical protein
MSRNVTFGILTCHGPSHYFIKKIEMFLLRILLKPGDRGIYSGRKITIFLTNKQNGN